MNSCVMSRSTRTLVGFCKQNHLMEKLYIPTSCLSAKFLVLIYTKTFLNLELMYNITSKFSTYIYIIIYNF